MGFWSSFKRLTQKQKILIGLSWIATGLLGPHVVLYFVPNQKQRLQEKQRLENEKQELSN
jgi:hypothetical protein